MKDASLNTAFNLFSVCRSHKLSRHNAGCWQQTCFPRLVFAGMVEVTHKNTPVCGHRRKGAAEKWEAPLEFTATALWFGEHAPCQQGGKQIDLEVGRRSHVHYQEIHSPGCKWKMSPTVRDAGLSLAGVKVSQNGWGWKLPLEVISSNLPAQAVAQDHV